MAVEQKKIVDILLKLEEAYEILKDLRAINCEKFDDYRYKLKVLS